MVTTLQNGMTVFWISGGNIFLVNNRRERAGNAYIQTSQEGYTVELLREREIYCISVDYNEDKELYKYFIFPEDLTSIEKIIFNL